MAVTEDTYGGEAVKRLLNLLKEKGIVREEVNVDSHSVGGKGNVVSTKTAKIVQTSLAKGFHMVLILVDSDREKPEDVRRRVLEFLGGKQGIDLERVRVVVFSPYIERLLAPDADDPISHLNAQWGYKNEYKKSDLPKLISRVDLNAVRRLPCFQELVDALNDP